MQLEGVYSVLPTPFTAAGDVDDDSLRRVVDLFIGAGVNGVTALGVTGEVARLDDRERQRVLEVVTSHVNGRIGVVAGTTAEGTRTCIGYSRAREGGRGDGGDGQPAAHAEAQLRGGRAPLPRAGRGGGHRDRRPGLSADLRATRWSRGCWRAIAREIPRARTIKLEDPPTPFKTSRILEQAAGLEVRIFGGLGGVFLLEELMAGATGAMTGFAYPEILVQIVKLFRAGQVDEAAEVFYRSVPLMRFEFQEGIGMAIRKEVLHRRGALASPATRLRPRARRDDPAGARSRAEVDADAE